MRHAVPAAVRWVLLAGVFCSVGDASAQLGGLLCGNGRVSTREQCDGQNLDGETCQSLGFTTGTLACDASCQFDTSGCASARFVDTGLTVIDNATGLEWEKKVPANDAACTATNQADRNVHCVNNVYSWSNSGGPPDGKVWLEFLPQLTRCFSNDGQTVFGGFAGKCDWRIPQIDELLTIAVPSCGSPPCVDPAFLPNSASFYWSGSEPQNGPTRAWFLVPQVGLPSENLKGFENAVRAVRNVTE